MISTHSLTTFHNYLTLNPIEGEKCLVIPFKILQINEKIFVSPHQPDQRREELCQSETEVRRKAVLVKAVRQDGEQLAKHYGLWNTQLREIEEDQQQRERKGSKVTLAVKV